MSTIADVTDGANAEPAFCEGEIVRTPNGIIGTVTWYRDGGEVQLSRLRPYIVGSIPYRAEELTRVSKPRAVKYIAVWSDFGDQLFWKANSLDELTRILEDEFDPDGDLSTTEIFEVVPGKSFEVRQDITIRSKGGC